MWLLLMACVLLVIIKVFLDLRRGSNFPPGPRGLPVIGNMLDMKKLMKEKKYFSCAFSYLAEKYGPVVGLQLGFAKPLILVSGREAVMEMLIRSEFDGRPDSFSFRYRTMGVRRGMIFTEGKVWSDHRRFTQKCLKDLGFGRRSMEDSILDNVNSLIITLEKNSENGVITNFSRHSRVSMLNNIWSLVSGSKLTEGNAKLQQAVEMFYNSVRHANATGGLLDHMPFLRFLLPEYSGFNFLKKHHGGIKQFLLAELARHKDMKAEDVPYNMISAYIEEIEKRKDDPTAIFNELELFALIKDFFAAGFETTNNSLGFFIVYISVKQNVQKKIQGELDRVFGTESLPSLDYKNNLPYLNATIAEVLRISHVVPTLLPHRALKDSTLLGYKIKKDYALLANITSIHMDKEHWVDPENFRPERFINDKGEFLEDSWVMPFGAGRRRCIGGTFAKDSLLLFTACLLQKFYFSLAPGEPFPCMTGINGTVTAPPNCKLLLSKR